MTPMNFEKTDPDNPTCEIAGGYKVIKYGDKFFAYFKPVGWKSFGNSCESTMRGNSVEYETAEDAKKACERHADKFPRPGSRDKILVY